MQSKTSLAREFREAVEGQRSKGFHLFEVSNKPEGITALLYCPPEGYEKYANDPTLSLEECQSGIFKAAFDYSRLAASGLMHGTLIDIRKSFARLSHFYNALFNLTHGRFCPLCSVS